MSREERRAYERMNRGRDPFAPPLSREAKARLEHQRQRRETRRRPATSGARSGRFVRWAIVGFGVIGLVAFSVAWPQGMPAALYIGLGAGVAWVVLAYLVRAAARRAATSGALDRRP